MMKSFILTTKKNNSYIYDVHHRLSMLVHPEFEKANKKSIEVDPYYLGKYSYLKKHGFFTNSKLADFGSLNESAVKESIVHTKQIVFEVTDFCNLNCTYCAFGELYEGFDARNHNNINTQSAITLLKYIVDLKCKNKNNKVNIGFYGGEPLLNIKFIKKIVEVVNQLKFEKDIQIDYYLTTNATLLHKHIDFLVTNKFNIVISLDGNEDNHSYRVFRKNKNNSFLKVIENVDMIQRDYPKYFSEHIGFNAVLHNRNSVKSIYEFIYNRYYKIPKVAELATDDKNLDRSDLYNMMFHSKRKSETEYQKEEFNLLPNNGLLLFDELSDFLKYFSINFYRTNITSLLHNEEKSLPTCTCLPFGKKVYLTTQNKLLTCEKINYKFSIGNVNNDVEINIQEIVHKYNSYYDHFKKFCQHCYAYRFCGLCMFNIKNLDKLGTEEFICERFYDQKAFKNKLYRLFTFLEKYPNDFF